jgi:hypothetical protein
LLSREQAQCGRRKKPLLVKPHIRVMLGEGYEYESHGPSILLRQRPLPQHPTASVGIKGKGEERGNKRESGGFRLAIRAASGKPCRRPDVNISVTAPNCGVRVI